MSQDDRHGTEVARRFREAADAGDPWAAAIAAAVERDEARAQVRDLLAAARGAVSDERR
jgi:hypothetical protein